MDAPQAGTPLPCWWFVVLQVEWDASFDDITAAYLRLGAENHPDRQRTEAERTSAAARMKTIDAAFERALQDCETPPSVDPATATVDDGKSKPQTGGSISDNPSGQQQQPTSTGDASDRPVRSAPSNSPNRTGPNNSAPEWMPTAGVVAVVIGVLGFIASGAVGGGPTLGGAIAAGVLNPLFFIGVPLGLYWLYRAGIIGNAPSKDVGDDEQSNANFRIAIIAFFVVAAAVISIPFMVMDGAKTRADTASPSEAQPLKAPRETTPSDPVHPAPPSKRQPPIDDDDKLAERFQQEEPSADTVTDGQFPATPPYSTPSPRHRIYPRTEDKNLAKRFLKYGRLAVKLGNYQSASKNYGNALDHDPDNLNALNELARLLATCPDAKFRDADRAVKLSEHLLELARKSGQRERHYLGTAAAAYAEHGDFDVAVRLQRQSIERTPDEHIAKAKRRLTLYENHKPFHGGPND